MSKVMAEKVEITIARRDDWGSSWEGDISVNGEWAAGSTGASFYSVFDSLMECAFQDNVGRDALYSLEEGK